MQSSGALSGIKVLDLSRLLPGPYCSMILADHGAHVTAIEDKRFKADKSFFKSLYRNKEHMTLNLKKQKGREVFYNMVKDADVFLEGFRPGIAQKLKIDYKTLYNINPKIIYCSITGYGQDGPLSQEPGHDINYLSRAGVLDLIGEVQGPPVIPGVQIADIAGGSMNAVIGILMALHARNKTGEGQYIDISMTDGLVGFLTTAKTYKDKVGHPPGRSNWILSHRYACYNTYETADGRYLSIGALENRFWEKLCIYFQVPEYISLQFDPDYRKEIIDYMRHLFKQKTLAQWDAELSGLDVCYSRVQNYEEVLKDPLFKERGVIDNSKNNSDDPSTICVPIKLSKTPGSIRKKAVDFGENTTSVLENLGYSQGEINNFIAEEVI
ncbi:MAG: CoA transferase [Desulfobacteraceae bacterium]|nr:CoA transferase [Desulfobacteraceae bacterium]